MKWLRYIADIGLLNVDVDEYLTGVDARYSAVAVSVSLRYASAGFWVSLRLRLASPVKCYMRPFRSALVNSQVLQHVARVIRRSPSSDSTLRDS